MVTTVYLSMKMIVTSLPLPHHGTAKNKTMVYRDIELLVINFFKDLTMLSLILPTKLNKSMKPCCGLITIMKASLMQSAGLISVVNRASH